MRRLALEGLHLVEPEPQTLLRRDGDRFEITFVQVANLSPSHDRRAAMARLERRDFGRGVMLDLAVGYGGVAHWSAQLPHGALIVLGGFGLVGVEDCAWGLTVRAAGASDLWSVYGLGPGEIGVAGTSIVGGPALTARWSDETTVSLVMASPLDVAAPAPRLSPGLLAVRRALDLG